MLRNKHIVLGITGSIAAYKACLIIRGLIKQGAEVQVVITPAGREFITPITLSTLTQKPVICDFFNHQDGTWNSHVDLGLWADAMLIQIESFWIKPIRIALTLSRVSIINSECLFHILSESIVFPETDAYPVNTAGQKHIVLIQDV